jgi:mRNA interferase MazF
LCAGLLKSDGLSTQISVGIDEGLKHESSVHCDELVSLAKVQLTRFIGRIQGHKLDELDQALLVALELE